MDDRDQKFLNDKNLMVDPFRRNWHDSL